MNEQMQGPARQIYPPVPPPVDAPEFTSKPTRPEVDPQAPPTEAADVSGAVSKFSGDLPDSAEALIGDRPVDVPSEPADLDAAVARYDGRTPSTAPDTAPSGTSLMTKAKVGGAVLLASAGIAKFAPNPSPVKSAKAQIEQGTSPAQMRAIDQERAALGMGPSFADRVSATNPNQQK